MTIAGIVIGGLALTLAVSEVRGLVRALFGRPSRADDDSPTTE